MTEPSAIPATRRQYKEMADGTLRVSIDVDPPYKQAFLKLFPDIDSPVALAPLVADFEQKPADEQKGGELARLAGILSNDPEFWKWISKTEYGEIESSEEAAMYIRSVCEIQSRRQLDHYPDAAKLFHSLIREPYLAYQKERGL